MKKALTYLTFIDLSFLLLLGLSGFINGFLGDAVYYLAFLLPVSVAIALKGRLDVTPQFLPLRLSTKNACRLLPLVAPTLAVIFVVSWITSVLLSFVGEGSVTDVSGNIVTVILTHAVLTPLLEELLFRYVPIAFLAPVSKKGAVWMSAMFFAFAHCSFYQIPYAFIAGVIFAAVDIAFDSIWPSVLIHFANNFISVFWLRCAESASFVTAYIVILFALALLSVAIIISKRALYKELSVKIFLDNEKYVLSCEPMLFFVTASVIAAFNL